MWELIKKFGCDIKTIFSNVKAEGSQEHWIKGRVILPILYKDMVKEMEFYLCPDLDQVLYLVIDFCKLYGLAPDVIRIDEIDTGPRVNTKAEYESSISLRTRIWVGPVWKNTQSN